MRKWLKIRSVMIKKKLNTIKVEGKTMTFNKIRGKIQYHQMKYMSEMAIIKDEAYDKIAVYLNKDMHQFVKKITKANKAIIPDLHEPDEEGEGFTRIVDDKKKANKMNQTFMKNTKVCKGKVLYIDKIRKKNLKKLNKNLNVCKFNSENKGWYTKSNEIISTRSEYEIKGKVISPKNLSWTVIVSDEEGFAQPTFSRVIHVRPYNEKSITLRDNRKIQSIGIAINDEERFDLIDKITFFGGDRCPPLGKMSFFDSPWDGIFGMDRMVRWITTYK